MTKEIVAAVAKKMSDCDLMTVGQALQAELESSINRGESATQAHIGKIELAAACSEELWARGYENGRKRDGSDLYKDVCVEDGIRYSFSVRMF